jgi:hypothetical protein
MARCIPTPLGLSERSFSASVPRSSRAGTTAQKRPVRVPSSLFNEIGSYEGQTAIEEQLDPGKYRAAIDADGDWTLKFEQPVPTSRAKPLPGTLKGHGARVVPVHMNDDLQPVIRGTHRGQSNFIVDVIGYGDVSGYFNLFNEIGRFKGEVLADEEMPAADYLVWVQADGDWTLKFSP